MRYFFVALTFLTRISIFAPKDWKEDDFKKSVKFFPMVGGILGIFYALFVFVFYLNDTFNLPPHLFSAAFIFFMFYLSGGLFFDGFMDTMDGIFSGRDRDKMLAIMKDSRVGANAVMAFVVYMLLFYGALVDIDKNNMIFALFSAPIISHFMVVISIKYFPYARKDGIGKMFSVEGDFFSVLIAAVFAMILISPCKIIGFTAFFISLIFTILFNGYLKKILGGVTGDTFGAVAVISFLLTLLVFWGFGEVYYSK